MKIVTLLLLVIFFQPATAEINLTVNNAPLDSVFEQIQLQSDYKFVYTSEQLLGTHPVSFEVKHASLAEVLAICFKDQPLSYAIEDKFIIVRRRVFQASVVTGKVVNENDEPLAGATVTVKKTNRVTQTDLNGDFTLHDVAEKTILVISNVGYETKEIVAEKNIQMIIRLAMSVSKLDEVKIIAYGTTTERLSTGDISAVRADDIQKEPVSNPLAALEGRVPGLLVTQASGLPGSRYTVSLRGQNSLVNGNDPLYIIDGVPFTSTSLSSTFINGTVPGSSPLENINPSDIQEIEILKDADATAIYGSRGANGVILITTKKGKNGRTKFDLNTYSGFEQLEHKMKLLNTPQYLMMRREAFNNDSAMVGPTDYDLNTWDTTRNTDWQKLLLGRSASVSDIKLTISGGNANTQFLISGEYHKETTVFPGNAADRKGSARINLNHQSGDGKLSINVSVSYMVNSNNLPGADLTSFALYLPPDAPAPLDSLGKLNWASSTWPNGNPLVFLKQLYLSTTDNLMSNFLFTYRIVPGLTAKISAGFTSISMNEIATYPLAANDPAYGITTGAAEFGDNTLHTWIAEPQLEYKKIVGKGKLVFLAGSTFQRNTQQGETITANGFINDALIENLGAASSFSISSSLVSDYRYNAIFGRISYELNDEFLFNLTGRRDGSSRFGPDRQFADFGAIGAGWIFTKEKFFEKRMPALSFGKIRCSYGTTGNDQIGDYQYLNSYTTTTYPYGGNSGLSPSRLFNPDYSWEINKKFESGIELGFFKDRLLIITNYFVNRSSSQLVGYPLAPTTGFSSVQSNLGAIVQNTGIEMSITTINIKNALFSWTTNFNFTIPRNKLIAFPDLQNTSYANTYVVGKPLSIVHGFHYTGVDPNFGVYTFEDVNKDGQISYPQDLTTFKQVSKDYYGGLENTISFHGVQLSVFFQFIKQTGRDYVRSGFIVPGFIGNQPVAVLNRWQKPGDNTNIEEFTQSFGSAAFTGFANTQQYGDNTVTDASFVRLKNISLSYQFPAALEQKWHLQDLRIYLLGQNLFTFTKYIGLDPQDQSSAFLPPLRIITAGIQITF